MTRPASLRVASGALLVLLAAAAIALTVATRDPWTSNDGLTVVLVLLLAAVGLLIVRSQQHNAVGWLCIVTAVLGLVDALVRLYLVFDYRQHHASLPLGRLAVDWRGSVSLLPFLVAFPSILLFPDGRVPSRRWRRALVVYVAASAVFSAAQFVGVLGDVPRHVAIDIRGNVLNVSPGRVGGVAWVAVPYFVGFWLASVGHQVRSFRRASGERRAQLKWLAGGAALCVVGSVVLVVEGDGNTIAARLAADAGDVAIAAFPVAIGVGILRYRLYEIDRLISRTISYSIVTGVLVAVFVGLILLTTDVLPFSSPVGVAASTLAAAALFNPLRGRAQRLVDRRFNRARYDAETAVAELARNLRDAVDVDAVQVSLLGAVSGAVEPAHVSVWLRGTS